MLCCNATAGQKILSMLPSFRRIMTTALFSLCSMTMWSLQYQAERTLSAFFHTMDCIRSWKRTEMVEHRASQDLSLDSVGLVAPLASSQLGTLLFWKNRWAGSFRFGIVLITSYYIFLHLIAWYHLLIDGLECPPRLSPSFVLSGTQLSQWSCPDVKHKMRKRNQNSYHIMLPCVRTGQRGQGFPVRLNEKADIPVKPPLMQGYTCWISRSFRQITHIGASKSRKYTITLYCSWTSNRQTKR